MSSSGIDVTLVVHRFERHRFEHFLASGFTGPYLIVALLATLRRRGVVGDVHVSAAAEPRRSDVAILHVDATIVPAEYIQFAATFPTCVNGAVADISKRSISTVLAGPDTVGPVIVKPDLNFNGRPEHRLNERAREEGHPEQFPDVAVMSDYSVYSSYGELPAEARDDSRLVVERFVPEHTEDGYALRHWIFCGDGGYCNRFVSPEPIVKGRNVIGMEPVPVPEELHQWRRDRGFDFGKFDFVVHADDVILLDANKTPGRIPPAAGDAARRLDILADGLESLIVGNES